MTRGVRLSAGRVTLSVAILSLLLLVYFSAPMAVATEGAAGDAYGAGSTVAAAETATETATGTDTATATPDTSAAPAGEAVEAAAASESQAASAQYVSTGHDLSLVCGVGSWGVYWDSREDYDAGLLSIDYRMDNKGTGTAYNVCIVEGTANNGVTLATPLPLSLGDIVGGGWKYFTLKWLVPKGVGSFKTDVQACVDCEEEDSGVEDGDEEEPGDEGDEDEPEDPGDDDESGDEGDKDDDDDQGGDLNGPGDQDNTRDEGVGGETPASNQTATDSEASATVYRSALPNTGAGLTADLVLGLGLGLFGLIGLTVAFRVAGARRH